MSQQGLRQASVRAVTGTALSYEGDWHALFDLAGVPAGDFDGRLLQWINARLSASHTELNGAMQAFAAIQGAANWSSLGSFNAGAAPAPDLPSVTGGYAAVFSNRALMTASYSGPVESACALTDTAATPVTPMDVYPLGAPYADPRAPNYAPAVAAFGSSFNIWKQYDQTGGGNHAVQATAAKRATVRYGLNVSRGRQLLTFGWNNTTGALVNSQGFDIPGISTSRNNVGLYVVGANAGGGGAVSLGGLGTVSNSQLNLNMTQNGPANGTGSGALKVTNSGSGDINSTLLPVTGGASVTAARAVSGSVTKFSVNDVTTTTASGLAAATMTGGWIGIDSINSGWVAWEDYAGCVVTNQALSDSEHAALVGVLKSHWGIGPTSRKYIATPHSLAFYQNPKVFNRTLWHQLEETTAVRWTFGMVGVPGRSLANQYQRLATEVTTKYDAAAPKMGFEIGTPSNDVLRAPIIGVQTSGSNVITGVNPIPWWVQAGVAVPSSNAGIPANTTVSSVDAVAHTVTLNNNATSGGTATREITTIPNGLGVSAITGTTTAGGATITGVSDTSQVVDGTLIVGAGLPATGKIILSHTANSITLESGTSVTAQTGGGMTIVDASKVALWGASIYDCYIAPAIAMLKALGPNVFVVCATGWDWFETVWTTTGASSVYVEGSARNGVLRAANARLFARASADGFTVVDDATVLGNFVRTLNALYSSDGAHIISTGNNPIGTLVAPLRKAVLDANS